MNQEQIKDAVVKENLFSQKEDLTILEIGDGNINYVYRISNGKKSYILKYAADYLRSSGRTLGTKRNGIESSYYLFMEPIGPYFPTLYGRSDDPAYFIMEDLKEYESLYSHFLQRKRIDNIGEQLAQFCISACRRGMEFHGEVDNEEMTDITLRLVFTEPFNDEQGRNQVPEGLEEFVRKEIYTEELFQKSQELKHRFIKDKETLLHGDLHDRSVWIKDTIRILDSEFATCGPIGFDAGMLLGNLYLGYLYHHFSGNDDFALWLFCEMETFYHGTKVEMGPLFEQDMLTTAGLEMIRRTIGDAKSPWMCQTIEKQQEFEKAVLLQGKEMVLEGGAIHAI